MESEELSFDPLTHLRRPFGQDVVEARQIEPGDQIYNRGASDLEAFRWLTVTEVFPSQCGEYLVLRTASWDTWKHPGEAVTRKFPTDGDLLRRGGYNPTVVGDGRGSMRLYWGDPAETDLVAEAPEVDELIRLGGPALVEIRSNIIARGRSGERRTR